MDPSDGRHRHPYGSATSSSNLSRKLENKISRERGSPTSPLLSVKVLSAKSSSTLAAAESSQRT
eukprot:scaffold304019_cov23-Tisochrysis_lutea.AAC.1